MESNKEHGMKGFSGKKASLRGKGCLHSIFFKIFLGIVFIFILFVLYNLVVTRDDVQKTQSEIDEEQEQKALLDTFDVVGDYFFPTQKASAEDLMTDDEKKAAEKSKEERNLETDASASPDGETTDDIIESADISSDTKPTVPHTESESTAAPSEEKVETPKIVPIE